MDGISLTIWPIKSLHLLSLPALYNNPCIMHLDKWLVIWFSGIWSVTLQLGKLFFLVSVEKNIIAAI